MSEIGKHVERYYTDTLGNFGSGAKGVGWKSVESQENRFRQLAKIIVEKNNFTINDLGCGTGDLVKFLEAEQYTDYQYMGYDVLDDMLDRAKKEYGNRARVSFAKVNGSSELETADYTVASGIFNLKYAVAEGEWLGYILRTLQDMDKHSKKGFAFNMLTKYSDKELMQESLYYADPLFLFDHCKINFSKNVALLHDYYEYDFTLLIRK